MDETTLPAAAKKKNLGPNKGKLFKRAELHLADPSLVATKRTHTPKLFFPHHHYQIRGAPPFSLKTFNILN